MNTLSNVETGRGQAKPPSVRLAPDTIPEAKSSRTGVSVKYMPDKNKNWYVLRASYGREDKASDYIVVDGTFVYIAKCRRKSCQSLRPATCYCYNFEGGLVSTAYIPTAFLQIIER